MSAALQAPNAGVPTLAARVTRQDWHAVHEALDAVGVARLPAILTADECTQLAGRYDDVSQFRSHVIMQQHGFGRGEYKYYRHPLPETITTLRSALYAQLAPLANRWHERLGDPVRFPDAHQEFLDRCHAAGQARPTPLLLKYGADDFNALHQDLYGTHVFPFQVVFLLSQPGLDFEGGEFVLTEQRPRMQSRAEVVPLVQGDAAIFAVHHRPVVGARGTYRVTLRHGVSRIRRGTRFATGVIFHDAT